MLKMTHGTMNVFDGCKQLETKKRGSFYKHNPACISDKRKQQVVRRMYRCLWS